MTSVTEDEDDIDDMVKAPTQSLEAQADLDDKFLNLNTNVLLSSINQNLNNAQDRYSSKLKRLQNRIYNKGLLKTEQSILISQSPRALSKLEPSLFENLKVKSRNITSNTPQLTSSIKLPQLASWQGSVTETTEQDRRRRLEISIERTQSRLQTKIDIHRRVQEEYRPARSQLKKQLYDVPQSYCDDETKRRFMELRMSHITRAVQIISIKQEAEQKSKQRRQQERKF